MKAQHMPDVYRKIAVGLLFLVSINALAAGYSFFTDPTGGGLGISTGYLRKSAPFTDYLLPGIVLFAVLGVVSSVIAVWALLRQKNYPFLILFQGSIIVGWIIIQLMMVTTFHILHLIIGVIGLVVMAIGYKLQKVRQELPTL